MPNLWKICQKVGYAYEINKKNLGKGIKESGVSGEGAFLQRIATNFFCVRARELFFLLATIDSFIRSSLLCCHFLSRSFCVHLFLFFNSDRGQLCVGDPFFRNTTRKREIVQVGVLLALKTIAFSYSRIYLASANWHCRRPSVLHHTRTET